jgi:hypothetical protein
MKFGYYLKLIFNGYQDNKSISLTVLNVYFVHFVKILQK